MSTQKRLSQLTIAAATLLVASISCFAQSETAKPQSDSENTVAVALNRDIRATEKVSAYSSVSNSEVSVETNEVATGFSPAKFRQAAKQSVANSNTRFQVGFEGPRVDEFSATAKTKSIEFIPSRGPKFPDKQ
jgi:hypothetical protein